MMVRIANFSDVCIQHRDFGTPLDLKPHISRSKTSHLSTSNLALRELTKTKIEPLPRPLKKSTKMTMDRIVL